MKDRTKDAAGLLRIVAGIMMFIGSTAAILLIFLGIVSMASNDANIVTQVMKTTGALLIMYGIIVALWHLLIYALLNGFSVLVENSDRTMVEEALFEIADSLRNVESDKVPEQKED